MKTRIRIALASAALVAGLAVAGSSPAAAQVAFSGSFPLPHGRISVGIGSPAFAVGSYVPYGYTVIEDPAYGYGFYYGGTWIPVQPYGSSWVIVSRPYYPSHAYVRPYYGRSYYGRPYSARPYSGYGYRGYDGRRSDNRNDHRGDRDRDRDRDGRGWDRR